MLRRTLAAAGAAALFAVPAAAQAAPGDLDPTFGGTGTVLDGQSFRADDVVVTADGGAVLASTGWTLVKLRADGTRDPGFGTGGVAVLADLPNSDLDALALDAQGRILVAGGDGAGAAVTRVLPDGTLDPTWGAAADEHRVAVELAGSPNTDLAAIAPGPGGTIVVAGTSAAAGIDVAAAAKLTPTGAYDATFSGDGRAEYPVAGLESGFEDLVADGFGGWYVAGFAGTDASLVHLRRDGDLDPFFGDAGRVRAHLGAAGDRSVLRGLAFTPNRRLIVAGVHVAEDFSTTALVGSFAADAGAPTPGFGAGGLRLVDIDVEENSEFHDVAASIDGDVVVTGAIGVTGDRDAVVARILGADGTLDPGFGAGGRVLHDTRTGGAVGYALTRDAYGAITATGTARDDILVLRIADRGATPRPLPQDPPPAGGGGGGGATTGGGGSVEPPPAPEEQASQDVPADVVTGPPAVHRPAAWFHRVRSAAALAGAADQGAARVQVSITRRTGQRCAAVTSSRRARLSRPATCAATKTRWLEAKLVPRAGKTTAWSLKLGARVPVGRYVATVRALDQQGLAGQTGEVAFRVKR